MHTDSGMTGISLTGFMPYMTVASLEMSDEPKIPLKEESFSDSIATFDMSVVFDTYFDLQH